MQNRQKSEKMRLKLVGCLGGFLVDLPERLEPLFTLHFQFQFHRFNFRHINSNGNSQSRSQHKHFTSYNFSYAEQCLKYYAGIDESVTCFAKNGKCRSRKAKKVPARREWMNERCLLRLFLEILNWNESEMIRFHTDRAGRQAGKQISSKTHFRAFVSFVCWNQHCMYVHSRRKAHAFNKPNISNGAYKRCAVSVTVSEMRDNNYTEIENYFSRVAEFNYVKILQFSFFSLLCFALLCFYERTQTQTRSFNIHIFFNSICLESKRRWRRRHRISKLQHFLHCSERLYND